MILVKATIVAAIISVVSVFTSTSIASVNEKTCKFSWWEYKLGNELNIEQTELDEAIYRNCKSVITMSVYVDPSNGKTDIKHKITIFEAPLLESFNLSRFKSESNND